jgi:hypothetical protein
MRYFYDTEFKEDGKTIDLISIGIVCEDGREYYAVSNEFDTRRVAQDNWLMQNVMSSIDHVQFVVADFEGKPLVRDLYVTDPAAISKAQMAQDILDFTAGTEVEWWNWYGAYDHVALCQIWGRMLDLPKGMPMYSNDIKQLHKQADFCGMPKQPDGLHNALEDAKFNVVRWWYLTQLLEKRAMSDAHLLVKD